MTRLLTTHILESIGKRKTFIAAGLVIVSCNFLIESLSI